MCCQITAHQVAPLFASRLVPERGDNRKAKQQEALSHIF
jgi:hypothetical protein